jgi:hypothetical protein
MRLLDPNGSTRRQNGQSAVLLSTSAMVGYDGHSETERVLVNNEGLAIPSLLKIQSFPTGNFGGLHICCVKIKIKIKTYTAYMQ